MSLVIAKKYDNYIDISADSIIINDCNITNINKSNCKLYTNNKNYILGAVNLLSDVQLLNEILKNNNKIKLNEPIELFDVYDIMQEFYLKLKTCFPIQNDEFIKNRTFNICFILITNNNIYYIINDSIEIINIMCIGVRRDAGFTYLANGSTPKEAVINCLKDCNYLSAPVYGYRYYLDREDNKIEEVI